MIEVDRSGGDFRWRINRKKVYNQLKRKMKNTICWIEDIAQKVVALPDLRGGLLPHALKKIKDLTGQKMIGFLIWIWMDKKLGWRV